MNAYDLGLLLAAIKAVLPPKRAELFCEILYNAAASDRGSETLRIALGMDRVGAQLRKFEVIDGDR